MMKTECFMFKVEEKKDGRRNLFGTGGLYKSWQCFRRMWAFSVFKNKGIYTLKMRKFVSTFYRNGMG